MKFLFEKIVTYSPSSAYYRISNADGKTWLMPARHMQVAMNLYQPSSVKGKLLKSLFPYLHKIGIVRRVVKVERMSYKLHDELKVLFCQIFHTSDLEFSMFCGTPCVHQKITIQLSKGKRILGYCKVTDHEEIATIFKREQLLLDTLSEKGMDNIPHCLYCGIYKNDLTLFVQTTTKSNHSTTDHRWNRREELFLKELYSKTKQKQEFEKTDFFQDLCYLRKHLTVLTYFDIETVESCINYVVKYYQTKEVEFSFYHGDFTPWNMYVEKGKLFVFDFEYAKRSYPPFLDYFHFLTQIGSFEKHVDTDGMWDHYQKEKINVLHLMEDTDFAYTCYLLCIISHYVKRENGIFSNVISQNLKLWIGLLKHIHHRHLQEF